MSTLQREIEANAPATAQKNIAIPSSNAEKITHGIFYTAITRAKEKLKIYWSSETMQEVVAGFSIDTSRQKSLAIIKEKLKQDKNT